MRSFVSLLSVVVLGACTNRVTTTVPAERSRSVVQCRAGTEGALRCALAGQRERLVDLPFAVHSVAPRAAGGAYALGAEGVLVRIGAHGNVTGAFETELVALATTEDYVCGIDVRGDVLCARDHHHDRACPGVPLPDWEPRIALSQPARLLRSAKAGGSLCVTDAGGEERCASGLARCERICLSYPSCSPLRCVDPCIGA
jgi:hypothetical protein